MIVSLQEKVTVGTDPDSTFQFTHELISEKHCSFSMDRNGMLSLIDEDSVGGTYLNDKRIKKKEKFLLRSGDVVRVGPLEITIESHDEELEEGKKILEGKVRGRLHLVTFAWWEKIHSFLIEGLLAYLFVRVMAHYFPQHLREHLTFYAYFAVFFFFISPFFFRRRTFGMLILGVKKRRDGEFLSIKKTSGQHFFSKSKLLGVVLSVGYFFPLLFSWKFLLPMEVEKEIISNRESIGNSAIVNELFLNKMSFHYPHEMKKNYLFFPYRNNKNFFVIEGVSLRENFSFKVVFLPSVDFIWKRPWSVDDFLDRTDLEKLLLPLLFHESFITKRKKLETLMGKSNEKDSRSFSFFQMASRQFLMMEQDQSFRLMSNLSWPYDLIITFREKGEEKIYQEMWRESGAKKFISSLNFLNARDVSAMREEMLRRQNYQVEDAFNYLSYSLNRKSEEKYFVDYLKSNLMRLKQMAQTDSFYREELDRIKEAYIRWEQDDSFNAVWDAGASAFIFSL